MRIVPIAGPANCGCIGLTVWPKRPLDPNAQPTPRQRIEKYIRQISDWRARVLVSVLEEREIYRLGVRDIGDVATLSYIWWFPLPFEEGKAPDETFMYAWSRAAPVLLDRLRTDERVVFQGCGDPARVSLVACCLLVELGLSADQALNSVRQGHADLELTPVQEQFIRGYQPLYPEKGTSLGH